MPFGFRPANDNLPEETRLRSARRAVMLFGPILLILATILLGNAKSIERAFNGPRIRPSLVSADAPPSWSFRRAACASIGYMAPGCTH